MAKNSQNISVLIPFYNEENNLSKIILFLQTASLKLGLQNLNVVFHNDNSNDNSVNIINSFKEAVNFDIHIINNEGENKGHGKSLIALKNYISLNKCEYVMTLDCDVKISLLDFVDLFSNLNENIVIGKRRRLGDGVVRGFITLTLEVLILFNTKVFWRDVNCPIRIYPYDKFITQWSSVDLNSIIPNVHITKKIILDEEEYKRINIDEFNDKKNSGVTWNNVSLLTKYKKLFSFCYKAWLEI